MNESKQKGELLEDVAELLLAVPGVQVQKRVKLRPPGLKQRLREIDLLVTGEVAWYPVRLPIECRAIRRGFPPLCDRRQSTPRGEHADHVGAAGGARTQAAPGDQGAV
jgi:hypothetical protein